MEQKAQKRFRLILPDRNATTQFAVALAGAIEDQAIVALIGPMGAGKTTLVQSVASALGVKELVNSPTFTMLNEYHSGRLPLYHLDLYRLSEADGAATSDLLLAELDDFIDAKMVAMIEWAELLPQFQPTNASTTPDPNQLDYLVVSLSTGQIGTSPVLARETGNLSSLPPAADQMHINKDEEVRYAEVCSFGKLSSALVDRLRSAVTAMLI